MPERPDKLTSPFEPELACDDCGARIDVGDSFTLPSGCFCLRCAAPHACEILDVNGSTHVTPTDIEDAAAILSTYAKVGKARKLARFAGKSGPALAASR